MKKILITMFAVTALAACKKEEKLATPTPAKPMNEQVADLIKKGDPAMYSMLYGNTRTVKPSVHSHPGVWHIPNTGGPENGFCISWPNCVCCVCIEAYEMVDESTPTDKITSDFHRSWTSPGDAELLINDEASTTVRDLKSLDVVFDSNGNSSVTYTTLQ